MRFWIILLVSVSSLCFGQEGDRAKDDPVFDSGKFAGQTLDQSIWQPLQEVTAEQKKALREHLPPNQRNNYYFVQNLRHNNKWMVAAIPKITADMNMMYSNMIPGGQFIHMFLHYQFQQDVILLEKENLKAKPLRINDIVTSSDGAVPEGNKYSFSDGFKGNLILTSYFTSLKQVFQDYEMDKMPDRVVVYDLPIDKRSVMKRALKYSIDTSIRTGYSRIYKFFGENNCCGQVFAALDFGLGINITPKLCPGVLQKTANYFSPLAWDGLAIRGLYRRGLTKLLRQHPRYDVAMNQP